MIILIIGGARSGKSRFGLQMASKHLGQKAYIATAQALDNEMKERIEKHKRERGADWTVYEEPLKIASLIKTIQDKHEIVLIDCLTLWLSNLMLNALDLEKEIDLLCSSLVTAHCSLFIVSNEVGLGIVPDNEAARRFRDLAGYLNQRIAVIADNVYFVAAGIPVKIK